MDHATIEEQGWIDRYHRGSLSVNDETRFETHFIACAECQEALEVARSFQRGIKRVAAEEGAQRVVKLGLFAWLLHHRARLVLVAAGVIAALGLGLALRENARLTRELAQLKPPSATVIEGPLTQPLVAMTTTLLSALRGSEGPERVVDAGSPYALAIDVGADSRLSRFGVAIVDANGTTRYAAADLRPNDLEVIQLLLPSGFLPAGDYRLRAHAFLPESEQVKRSERVDLGDFPFRVATDPG